MSKNRHSKIVHLIFSLNVGGAELMLIDIINQQIKHEDVSLIIVNNSYQQQLIKKLDPRVKLYLIKRKSGGRNPYSLLKLNYLIRKINPSVIHCHNSNMIGLLFGKNIIHKSILTVHATGVSYTKLKDYAKLFSISKAVYQDVKDNHGLNSTIIYNGVDNNIIKIKDYKSTNSSIIKILQIGRLDHKVKGQDILLKAFSKVSKELPHLCLTLDFIGTGESLEYLHSLSKELNIEDKVTFLGLKDREFIQNNLHTYDLLIQPSRSEGFGLTIVEAMFAKVPVLISNLDGPMEIINQGLYGDYFQSGDTADLERKLTELLINNQQMNLKVDNAHIFAKDKFSISCTAASYLEQYKLFI